MRLIKFVFKRRTSMPGSTKRYLLVRISSIRFVCVIRVYQVRNVCKNFFRRRLTGKFVYSHINIDKSFSPVRTAVIPLKTDVVSLEKVKNVNMVIVIKFICNTAFIYSNIASKTEFHAKARLVRLYPPPPIARILPLQYSSAIAQSLLVTKV